MIRIRKGGGIGLKMLWNPFMKPGITCQYMFLRLAMAELILKSVE